MSSAANTGSSKPLGADKEFRTGDLLRRVAERDVEALAGLYDQFAPQLMGLLLRILSARPEAEHTLQEVFVRLWKEAPSIAQTKGSLAAWLVLTSRHIAVSHLRAQRLALAHPAQSPHGKGRTKEGTVTSKSCLSLRRKEKARARRSSRYDSDTPPFLAAFPQFWMPGAQDIALVDFRMGLLQKALNQMPKPQRQALELAVFDGYTESEIAERLGEPLGKVNAGLRAAFTFLRHRQHAVLGTWTAEI